MEQSPCEANRFSASQENLPHFMEPEGSLPQSQRPATCPYPGPARSSPCPPISHFLKSILILFFYLRWGLPSGLFPSGFPTKTLYKPLLSPIHATCPAILIRLDFITRTVLSEEECWLTATANSTYPQLPCILEAVPPSAT